MTVNYTTNLALGQPVTGTESGTWGDDVNNAVTSYLDIAIAGGLAVTVTTADVTLTLTQGTSSATNIGSTTAQYAILNVSGAMTAARNLIVPSSSRQYVINNNTTGGFLLTVKGSATSGVTLVNGEKAHVFWNGTDYAKMSNASGGAGSFSSITDSGNLNFTGTGNRITGDFSNGTFANRVMFQTSTANSTTAVEAIPSGTGVNSTWTAYNNSDPTNASFISIGARASTDGRIESSIRGTGTYLPMTFYTSGSERMRLDTSGNVGIGGTPAYKLDVISSAFIGGRLSAATGTNGVSQIYTNTGGNFSIGIDASTGANFGAAYGGFLWHAGAYPLLFGTSNAERMRIDSSGNVGIGTSSPSTYGKFVVAGGDGNTQFNVGTSGVLRVAGYNSAYSGALLESVNTAQSAYLPIAISGSYAVVATSGTERMRIDSSGNVGIGTTSGSARLNVNGGTSTSQIRWEVNNAAFTQEVSTNAAVNAYVYKSNDASYHVWKLSSTEAMRLDSSGNVGIGVTPTYKFDVNGLGRMRFVAGTGAGYWLDTTGNAVRYFVGTDAATESWRIYDSVASSQRLIVDSSGNVGIGTSSPSSKFDVVGGRSTFAANSENFSVYLRYNSSTSGFYIGSPSADAMAFSASSGAERMRITSDGDLLLGITSAQTGIASDPAGTTLYSSAVKGVGVFVRSSGFPLYVNNKAASGGLVQFYCNGNTVGDISSNGTTTSYNITSDQRLKQNIQDAESASTLIDALQVRQFDWKTDNTHQRYGFIAQELVTVAPEAVHQPTDPEEMMAVDYSKLVPMLVKEIQSLRKRLADAGIA